MGCHLMRAHLCVFAVVMLPMTHWGFLFWPSQTQEPESAHASPAPNLWLYAPVIGSSQCASASAPQGVGTLRPSAASGTAVRPRVPGTLGSYSMTGSWSSSNHACHLSSGAFSTVIFCAASALSFPPWLFSEALQPLSGLCCHRLLLCSQLSPFCGW